jgi:hypothetical protein
MNTLKIGSLTLALPSPYGLGHLCTAAEAAILNRELQARLRNNIRERFWDKKDQELKTPSQNDLMPIQAYIRSFSLNGRDPLESTSFEIALSIVRHQIKASGKNLRDYTKAALNAEAKKVLQGPKAVEIRTLAKRRIGFIEDAVREEMEKKLG